MNQYSVYNYMLQIHLFAHCVSSLSCLWMGKQVPGHFCNSWWTTLQLTDQGCQSHQLLTGSTILPWGKRAKEKQEHALILHQNGRVSFRSMFRHLNSLPNWLSTENLTIKARWNVHITFCAPASTLPPLGRFPISEKFPFNPPPRKKRRIDQPG